MIYSKIDYFENSIYFDDNNNQKINFDVESIGNDIVKLQYHCQIWNIRDFLNEMFKKEIRNIKLDIIEGKYNCIDAYKIPRNFYEWNFCPNCGLRPLTWEFNNGSSTGCGCGSNRYNHFSIVTESIMSHIHRNDGSALHYNGDKLRDNWNHWCETSEELETFEGLKKEGKW